MFSGDYRNDCRYPGYECYGKLLDAYLLELDPVENGFSGVVVELYMIVRADRIYYEVRQSATLTANRLLVFSSEDERLARAVFEGDVSVKALVAYGPAAIG